MTSGDEVDDLIALIDRLEGLMERSALAEIEVEAGATTVVLRSPAAIAATGTGHGPLPLEAGTSLEPPRTALPEPFAGSGAHEVVAPLTGVFYGSPSPDAEPYVRAGAPVNTGQVIGLIEAMKLFNEIKSDVTGTVRRIVAGDGDLVKAKQTLIEVDPS